MATWRSNKLGLPALLALTAAPALVVGAGLWFLADIVPQCTPDMRNSITSPDGATKLVIFSLDCDATTGPNTQAAIHPAAEPFSSETAQTFFSADGEHDLAARWDADGNIEIIVPQNAAIYRQAEDVADLTVVYR